MNRRVALAISFVGLTLMACCCGGAGIQPKVPQQVVGGNVPNQNQPLPQVQPPQQKVTKAKFNPALIEKYQLKEREFPSLQYYLASDLVISRELSKEDSKRPQKGKLVQSKGQSIEEIGITSQTPGVCLEATTDGASSYLTLSFEKGTQMLFRRRANEDSYTAVSVDKGGESEVRFLDNNYKASTAAIRAAYVVVGEQSLENFQRTRKDLKGVPLPGQ
jgi:hypothetical protein